MIEWMLLENLPLAAVRKELLPNLDTLNKIYKNTEALL